jgi:hypothetical protein
VFTAPLHSNGSYSIVGFVFVAAGICLQSRCLAIYVYSDFNIPAFGGSCHNIFVYYVYCVSRGNICLFNLFNLPLRCSDQDGSRNTDLIYTEGKGPFRISAAAPVTLSYDFVNTPSQTLRSLSWATVFLITFYQIAPGCNSLNFGTTKFLNSKVLNLASNPHRRGKYIGFISKTRITGARKTQQFPPNFSAPDDGRVGRNM